jgi:hypothetical protein
MWSKFICFVNISISQKDIKLVIQQKYEDTYLKYKESNGNAVTLIHDSESSDLTFSGFVRKPRERRTCHGWERFSRSFVDDPIRCGLSMWLTFSNGESILEISSDRSQLPLLNSIRLVLGTASRELPW